MNKKKPKMGTKRVLVFFEKIWLAVLIICTIMITVAKMPATYVLLTLEFSGAMHETEVCLNVDGEEVACGRIQNGSVAIPIEEEQYQARAIEFEIDQEIEEVQGTVYFSSRNHVLFQMNFSETADDISIIHGTDYTGIRMEDAFLKHFHKACNNDWRLKVDILLPIWGISLIGLSASILIRRKKCRFKAVLFGVVTVLALIFIFVKSPEPKKKFDPGIGSEVTTQLISKNTKISQSFRSSQDIYAVVVRFGTMGRSPLESFIGSIQDPNTGDILQTVKINGNTILDNQDYTISFEHKLEKNREYMLTITSESENGEAVLWKSSQDEYAEGSLYVNGEPIEGDLDFCLLTSGPNVQLILVCVLAITAVLIGFILFGKNGNESRTWKIRLIYGLVFCFCLIKTGFYYQNLHLGVYDELAHVSYIVYMEEEKTFVPQFDEMKLLVPYETELTDVSSGYTDALYQTGGTFDGKVSETINFLGHPPLYYWLCAGLNTVSVSQDHVYVDLEPLRVFNMIIVMSSILIFFYIGYTRLKKMPILHLIYAILVTCVPMLCYTAATISNDNLTILTVAVFFLGCLRFAEGRKNFATYFLIASGITATLLTKLTAGMIVTLAALIFVIIHCMRERSLKDILNKYMLATLPIYFVGIIYYLLLFQEFHTLQPSLSNLVTEEVYQSYAIVYVPKSQRVQQGFWQFVKSYWEAFLGQWTVGIPWETADGGSWILHKFPYLLLWLAPIVGVAGLCKQKKEKILMGAFSASLLITLLTQFIRGFKDFQFVSGHGSTQSRYYVCVVLIMAFILVKCIDVWLEKSEAAFLNVYFKEEHRTVTRMQFLKVCGVIFTLAVVYSGFAYFLLNKVSYALR